MLSGIVQQSARPTLPVPAQADRAVRLSAFHHMTPIPDVRTDRWMASAIKRAARAHRPSVGLPTVAQHTPPASALTFVGCRHDARRPHRPPRRRVYARRRRPARGRASRRARPPQRDARQAREHADDHPVHRIWPDRAHVRRSVYSPMGVRIASDLLQTARTTLRLPSAATSGAPRARSS
jgi:hypothetical protein